MASTHVRPSRFSDSDDSADEVLTPTKLKRAGPAKKENCPAQQGGGGAAAAAREFGFVHAELSELAAALQARQRGLAAREADVARRELAVAQREADLGRDHAVVCEVLEREMSRMLEEGRARLDGVADSQLDRLDSAAGVLRAQCQMLHTSRAQDQAKAAAREREAIEAEAQARERERKFAAAAEEEEEGGGGPLDAPARPSAAEAGAAELVPTTARNAIAAARLAKETEARQAEEARGAELAAARDAARDAELELSRARDLALALLLSSPRGGAEAEAEAQPSAAPLFPAGAARRALPGAVGLLLTLAPSKGAACKAVAGPSSAEASAPLQRRQLLQLAWEGCAGLSAMEGGGAEGGADGAAAAVPPRARDGAALPSQPPPLSVYERRLMRHLAAHISAQPSRAALGEAGEAGEVAPLEALLLLRLGARAALRARGTSSLAAEGGAPGSRLTSCCLGEV